MRRSISTRSCTSLMKSIRMRRRIARAAAMTAPLMGTLLGGGATQEGKKVTQEVVPRYSAASPEFREAAGSLLGGNFVSGNNITTAGNEREVSPAMLNAASYARRA